ncbi:thioredoxin domain-containing protein [Tessaracoccus caeni]|uniref:thioredoxin domain-containing protein n=1 Tax=Tessaracoccus caeni TaxID=3031239 RepID=UPI0023DCD0B3|nr:thioredoxin domain-containing protein [Tessaracoccus caeni]MDF1489127.1 thioredoxin domain-containing protein [Tessaracoccus caeni]
MNRLGESSSDYLRQHAHQAVDWWEWSPEALAEAQRLDRPVLLSIGYASCHWCHVMSHESFDDASIAQLINANFVAIKVDRQQLPEVDTVFMTATQAMNGGAGGWPLTAFLTPDAKPFFTGTYFPPEPRDGLPSFRQVLEILALGWQKDRTQLVDSAHVIAAHLGSLTYEQPDAAPEPREALDAVQESFDLIHGGFGTAPKFPAPTLIDALLVKGDPSSLELAQRSLEAMARGGIYDQVGGGFHRYSVDPGWVVPHFEKMLYDNALLLGSYIRGWRRTADHDAGLRVLFERTAYGIVDWLEREMVSEHGAFMAGLDADSCDIRGAVHEGIYYLWNPALLEDSLGAEDAQWAQDVFHVTSVGTFEDGLSTLQLRGRPDFARLDAVVSALRAERENRFRPATDSLVVSSWNGWTISSLITGAFVFNEPGWLALAERAARHLMEVHVVDGTLRRSSRDGVVGESIGSAEDFGAVAEAFALLAGATGDAAWLRAAEALVDQAVELFGHDDGGFYDGVETGLFTRPRTLTDNVTPNGTSALILALRVVGLLAERPELIERADRAAKSTWQTLHDTPRFAGSALADLLIADEARRGLKPATAVVVVDDPFDELARATWRMAPAGSAILVGAAGTQGFGSHFDARERRGTYVCRGTVCFDPVDDYNDLKTPLWSRV